MNYTVIMIVRCVNCKNEKEIKAGEISKDDVIICNKCFMPMVPDRATGKLSN